MIGCRRSAHNSVLVRAWLLVGSIVVAGCLLFSGIATASGSSATASASAGTCLTGPAVVHRNVSYCPAAVKYVKSTGYGVGKRVFINGVTVVAETGFTIRIKGGPYCPPRPDGTPMYCGAWIPDWSSLPDVAVVSPVPPPKVGSLLTVYGVTDNGFLKATGYDVLPPPPPVPDCGIYC